MKILFLDIETAPNIVHVWGLYDQNVAINQIISAGYVMCWSAKWYGRKPIIFDSVWKSKQKPMLERIHSLMDEADAVVHYNGKKFDIPTLQKEFVLHSLPPPSPAKQIDLLNTTRQQFKFASNKLDFVCQQLGLGEKIPHTGHQLWIDCMAGRKDALKRMERYNRHDVRLLERLYVRLLPWIKHHPDRRAYDHNAACPSCASKNVQSRGFEYTKANKYRRFQCQDCRTWFRASKSEKP